MRILCIAGFSAALAFAQQQHDITPVDIEEGARYFGNFCAQCHGAEGNAMTGADLSRPNLRRATNDNLLASIMQSGLPGTAMPPNALRPREVFTIVAYINSLRTAPPRAASAGSAGRGQALFTGKGGCSGCHRVGDKGGFSGPNLTEIGLLRRVADLERSLLDPAAEQLSQNAMLVAVTQSGAAIRGRVMNQDSHTVQLMDTSGQLQSLRKDTLRSLTRETTTPMPSYRTRLTAEELSDVVAYLTTLRGN
jgi:putative heme-binding domain-containing protein